MIENINDVIGTEKWNLEQAENRLNSLKKNWFKFGKTQLMDFLEVYIKEKECFIEKLTSIMQPKNKTNKEKN